MKIRGIRRFLPILVAAMLAVATFGVLGGTGIASAAPARHAGIFTCSGSAKSPGVLSGSHLNVVVAGICVVNAGRATVAGNVIVTPRSVLLAAFGLNDTTHKGTSSLTVGKNLLVGASGTLILGCEAAHFPCLDDPHPKSPTLNSPSTVHGNLIAVHPLGVVMHLTSIGANVLQAGGGSGVNCKPAGIFAAFKSPVYSDYEDNTITGSVAVLGLQSCWLGLLRNHVTNALVAGNQMFSKDAMEVLANSVRGSLACLHNSPAVQFGDSTQGPNLVSGRAAGQCGFNVVKPDPAPNGPLKHISLHV